MSTPDLEELMNTFHSVLGPENLQSIMQKFNSEVSISDMFKNFWDIKEAHRCLTPTLVDSKKKSEKEANRLRELGNKHFDQRDFAKALETYNLSILTAPHSRAQRPYASGEKDSLINGNHSENISDSDTDGEALSLCYASRSAVLYELQHYDLCLSDIKLANGCPTLQRELEERKKKCLEAAAAAAAKESPNDQEKYQCNESSNEKTSTIPVLTTVNPTIPCLSSSCRLAYTPEKGRHVIVTKNIHPGDVVLVEKAYCSSLYFENLSTHCSTCLRECVAPLPCPDCSMVVFCSTTCQLEGLSGIHWLECCLLPTMIAMDIIPVYSNACKLLRRTSCTQWRGILQVLEERTANCSPVERGMNLKGIIDPEDFESIFGLCTNVDIRHCGDLYVKCLIAFVLTKLLQLSGHLFVDEFGRAVSPSEEDLLFTGQFLFSNLMKVSCNGFNISEFQWNGPSSGLVKKDIGAGVYPISSLINHSCHPSALPYSYGRYHVLRAARNLSEGDEITIGYCRGSYMTPVEERQTYLSNVYQFECSCEACVKEWPLYGDLPDPLQVSCIVCSQPVCEKKLICPRCSFNYSKESDEKDKQIISIKWKEAVEKVKAAHKTILRLMRVMTSGKSVTKKDLNTICNAASVLEKHLSPPSWILWDARDTLEMYFHLEKLAKVT